MAYQAEIWCISEQTEQYAPAPKGWGWTLHKDLYGMCYLLPPRPVVNLLNVAAKVKEDVPLGVHAERQVGIVLIFAVVTVRIPVTEFNVFYAYNTIIYCFYYSLILFLDPENIYLINIFKFYYSLIVFLDPENVYLINTFNFYYSLIVFLDPENVYLDT